MDTATVVEEESGRGASGRPLPRVRNHWIVLDAAWAERLGVRREAGVWRIRSSELARRLALLSRPPVPNAGGSMDIAA